ncbi:MAG: DUF4097 family beta strand repeat protein [Clostridia bacterium]|nr:DUF4097 family beta strand repeat protein [Clostridia bacterium]
MGKFINGINFGNFNGAVVINGRIVSGGWMSGGGVFGTPQKFDEKKNVPENDVERITVKSDSANIVVTASNTSIVEAHFSGEAVVDEKPTFNIEKRGCEVIITLDVGAVAMSNLTLTVNIPTRTFEFLSVTCYNGNVSVKNGVFAKKIRLDTHNGEVDSEGNFCEILATTHNGDVDVYIKAKNNVEIEASSHNGDVSVEMQNVATSSIYASSHNGNVRNRFHAGNGVYAAYGRATSHNGNVTVK